MLPSHKVSGYINFVVNIIKGIACTCESLHVLYSLPSSYLQSFVTMTYHI